MLALGFWSVFGWIGIVVGVLAALLVIQMIHLAAVFAWSDKKTLGSAYFGQAPEERARFKRQLRTHARLLFPVLRLLSMNKFVFANGTFQHGDVAGPKGMCSLESFRKGAAFRPRPGDVFVATQMKCGTTWMQNVVYEVLMRGQGTLVDEGKSLHAVSPWLEARKTVPVDEAPLVGKERPSRIIKTHLPTSMCPYSEDAKYIHVGRHPLSCFASCIDFVQTNIGAFTPPFEAIEEWFCSEKWMWWGTWPTHLKGWWDWSQSKQNVLFVTFEEMKKDLPGIVRRVAGFLGVKPLDEEELGNVVRKCGFAYMKEHSETFDMHPPHLLQTDAELFVSGKADRHKDLPEPAKQRILQWCRERMEGSSYPLATHYPDVAEQADAKV